MMLLLLWVMLPWELELSLMFACLLLSARNAVGMPSCAVCLESDRCG